jgi:hypothetical protein
MCKTVLPCMNTHACTDTALSSNDPQAYLPLQVAQWRPDKLHKVLQLQHAAPMQLLQLLAGGPLAALQRRLHLLHRTSHNIHYTQGSQQQLQKTSHNSALCLCANSTHQKAQHSRAAATKWIAAIRDPSMQRTWHQWVLEASSASCAGCIRAHAGRRAAE